MKNATLLFITLASVAALTSCNEKKAAINAQRDATKDAIDDRKVAVENAAELATKQADVDAEINKANIKAANQTAQAQLDANKERADAEAAAEKARVNALTK
jgi:hypothetical protein